MAEQRTQTAGLDDLDRQIVVVLKADGRASWTSIAAKCGASVATIARRGQQLLRDGLVRVTVLPDYHHAGVADLFLARLRCVPGRRSEVVAALVRRDDLRYLALVSGAWEIIAEVSVGPGAPAGPDVLDQLHATPGLRHCEADLTTHIYKSAHEWSRQLVTGEAPAVERRTHDCGHDRFTDGDQQILELMRQDGRASFRSIAESLGLDESTVRRRFDVLWQRGCIRLVTTVPPHALGFSTEIIVEVVVAPALLDPVAREVSRYREVRYVAALLGRNVLLCAVDLADTKDIHGFMAGRLAGIPGVDAWTASAVRRTLRRDFVETA